MILQLHDCVVSRRGKAAKGTVAVKMFGRPILDANKVAKDFDLVDAVKDRTFDEIVNGVKAVMEVNDQILGMALLDGLNTMRRSENSANSNEAALLANRIFANGLAVDKHHAEKLAALWVPQIRNAVEMEYVDSFEDGILDRMKRQEKIVAQAKADGQWVSMAPRLVTKREVSQ